MAGTNSTNSQKIRQKVGHPIIDADGHILELEPIFLDYVREVGGGNIAERFARQLDATHGWGWFQMSEEERRKVWATAGSWWFAPTQNTLDRATASLPKLLYRRLEEFGIDFSVVYPTSGLGFVRLEDNEVRQVACRAMNIMHAQLFGPYADRMTPAAIIPMHTPGEAIEELDFSVTELGLKASMIAGPVVRPIPQAQEENPKASMLALRLDNLGLDSDYDYDPFWARCVELGVAPASHANDLGWRGFASIHSYMYNHMGTFARSHEVLCKSLFISGLFHRIPQLKIAFLEGGVGWACNLYAGMIARWQKRGGQAIKSLDPANLDLKLFKSIMEEYGDDRVRSNLGELLEWYSQPKPSPSNLDEWHRCHIDAVQDIKGTFETNFYFGCEADDPINAWAFNANVNPFGARLKAIFSSDIGHWDVPDMREVVEEAYELVEHELITEEDFRDFTFANAVTLYGGMDPDFFKGTAVEAEVEKVLSTL